MSAIADHHRISRRGVGMAALVAALAMTGCTFGTGEPGSEGSTATDEGSGASDGTDPQTASEDTGSEDTDSEDTAVVDEGAAAAGVDLTDVGEAIATAEVPAVVEGDTAATMTVALHGLRREGRTVLATYSFTVNSETSDAEEWLYDYLGGHSWHPYAVDTVNLNKHGVLSGAAAIERAQTDSQGMEFRPGQTLFAYAMFAAPPEAVTTMDVLLVEGAPLATGVEIR